MTALQLLSEDQIVHLSLLLEKPLVFEGLLGTSRRHAHPLTPVSNPTYLIVRNLVGRMSHAAVAIRRTDHLFHVAASSDAAATSPQGPASLAVTPHACSAGGRTTKNKETALQKMAT